MGRQGLAREYSWAVGFLGIFIFLGRLLCNLSDLKDIQSILNWSTLSLLLLFIVLEMNYLPLKGGLAVSLSFSAILSGYLIGDEMGACVVSMGALVSGYLKKKDLRIILFNTSVLLLASMIASKVALKVLEFFPSANWATSQSLFTVAFALPFIFVNGTLVFYYGYLNSPENKLRDLGYNTFVFAVYMVVASLLAFVMMVIHFRWGPSNFYLSVATIGATVSLVSTAGKNALSKEGLINLYKAVSSINEALTLREVFENAYISSKSIIDIDLAWLAVPRNAGSTDDGNHGEELVICQTWAKPGVDIKEAIEELNALQKRKESLQKKEMLYWNKETDKPHEGYLGKILSMPLVHQGQFLAEFGIASLSTEKISQETLEMFAVFSSHMTLAVDNALKYEEASQLASQDPLTGLYNYREFHAAFSQFIERSRKTGSPVSLIYIDLDHFREVNNRYGHQIGDEVLKEIALIFKQSCRETDLVARIGGDEFAVILPGTSRAIANQVAERIRGNLLKASFWPTLPDDSKGTISASLGVAVFPEDGQDIQSLVRQADMSMFSAKVVSGDI